MPGPHATTAASASRDVPRDRERAVHRHRFVVAAERVPAGDRRVDELAVAELARRDRTARAAARRRRSSRTRAARRAVRCLNATAIAGSWLCSAAATTGMPVDRVDVGELGPVLLGAADVGLQARVARLHACARARARDHSSRVEVPVHDVPAAGAEPELDRGRVHDDAVADVDRAR